MAERLRDKIILVTGAGSGIGRASAIRFAAEGATVAACDINADTVQVTVDQIAADGGRISPFVVDVTDAAQVEAVAARINTAFGQIDGVFNVAGGSGRKYGDGPADACTIEGWTGTLQLNLTSTFLVCKFALTYMMPNRSGSIVNLSSVLGMIGHPDFATHAYAASKGAIISFSRAMAVYYAPHHIRVNVIAPGLIETAMSQRAQHNDQVMNSMAALQPLGEPLGKAEDVAAAAAYLLSDDSRFVTGIVLPIDSGWTAQ